MAKRKPTAEQILGMNEVQIAKHVPAGTQKRFADKSFKPLKLRVNHGVNGISKSWQLYVNDEHVTKPLADVPTEADALTRARTRAINVHDRLSRGIGIADDPAVDSVVEETGVLPSFAAVHALWRKETIISRSSDPETYARKKRENERQAKVRLDNWMANIAEKRIDEIVATDIEACAKKALAAGHKVTSNKILTEAVSVLGYAEARYEKQGFRMCKKPGGRVKVETRKDRIRIDRKHWPIVWAEATPIVRWLMLTGHRPSMAYRLRWADVDIDAGRYIIAETKKGETDMVFPLCDEQIAILEQQREITVNGVRSPYVFPIGTERRIAAKTSPLDHMTIDHVDADCTRIQRDHDVPVVTPYSFRTTVISLVDNKLPQVAPNVGYRLTDHTPSRDARSVHYRGEPDWDDLIAGHKTIVAALMAIYEPEDNVIAMAHG